MDGPPTLLNFLNKLDRSFSSYWPSIFTPTLVNISFLGSIGCNHKKYAINWRREVAVLENISTIFKILKQYHERWTIEFTDLYIHSNTFYPRAFSWVCIVALSQESAGSRRPCTRTSQLPSKMNVLGRPFFRPRGCPTRLKYFSLQPIKVSGTK